MWQIFKYYYEAILQKLGVEHQTTVPYTSAYNGKSEWMHCTIMGGVRAMCSVPNSPKPMGEFIMAVFHIATHPPDP